MTNNTHIKALIKRLNELCDYVAKGGDVFEEAMLNLHEDILVLKEHLSDLLNELEQHQWVKCSDRLPDIGMDLLVSDGDSYVAWAYLNQRRKFVDIHGELEGITHWMPLPKPPKGVEE